MWDIEIKSSNVKKIASAIDIADALDKCYKYPSDVVIIKIKNTEISLPIVHSFSDLLDDFLGMLNDLQNTNQDFGNYGFSQNLEFDADFKLYWDSDTLLMKFDWRFVKNKSREALPNEITISKKKFIHSWLRLFDKIFFQINLESIKLEYYDEKNNIESLKNNTLFS